MDMYEKLLKNQNYLEIVKKIESFRFITDGKWDWEHGLGHFKRVANYVKIILEQLHANKRTIELGMLAGLLHDIGLSKGDKQNHAVESSQIFSRYLQDFLITPKELEEMQQAIFDHSNGIKIKSLIGMALLLG